MILNQLSPFLGAVLSNSFLCLIPPVAELTIHMRLITLFAAGAFGATPGDDICSQLCQRDGPAICNGGSWTKPDGTCHAYLFLGDPANNRYCYHTAANAAVCPSGGRAVRASDVSRLLRVDRPAAAQAPAAEPAPRANDASQVRPEGRPGREAGGSQGSAPARASQSNNSESRSNRPARSVARIAEIEERCRREVDTIFGDMGACPPGSLIVDGQRYEWKSDGIRGGSSTEVRVSRDDRMVVKTLLIGRDSRARSVQLFERLCTERAVHEVVGDLWGGAVVLHSPAAGQLTPACAATTMVADFGGKYQLWDLTRSLTDRQLAQVGSKIVRILRSLHAYGVVHGDIHAGNFVTSHRGDPAEGLKIIDFGLATPYIDANGRHIPQGVRDVSSFCPNWLSPWELQGKRLSRRDDMFRASELLLRVRIRSPLGYRAPSIDERIALKRAVQTDAGRVLSEFHQAMVNLKFDEAPDYDYWAHRFDLAAEAGAL